MDATSNAPEGKAVTCGEPWLEDPRLLPLLPMIYVAWADGDLELSEVARIRAAIGGLPWLDDAARRGLERWLDAAAPPSVRDMTRLLRTIREGAASLAPDARVRLADVGIEVARRQAPGRADEFAGEDSHAALQRLEDGLGIVGHEAARDLFAPPVRPSASPASSASTRSRS